MLSALEYPYNVPVLLKKRRRVRRALLEQPRDWVDKNIAVLGGSTTHDVVEMLELFLLKEGIRPHFYQSEYGQYWQDAMFPGEALTGFKPDFIYIHTTVRNLLYPPQPNDTASQVEEKLAQEYARYTQMWESLAEKFGATVIQNNFELPAWRLLGNRDAADHRGVVRYVQRLNGLFAEHAEGQSRFYLHDIQYLAAQIGLDSWHDTAGWHMYKYAIALNCIPPLAASVSHIVKAVLGKNKKLLALDLDNTLWGGVIGDDGAAGIEIGNETAMGQVYLEFQQYLRRHKALGVLLGVASKNEEANALAGLNHPEGALKPEDFVSIKANWEPKSENLLAMASELNLFPDSFVFVDDNPAEREIVRASGLGAAVPELDKVEHYIRQIDHAGYFESVGFSEDDEKRAGMYAQNMERLRQQSRFASYDEYLQSLAMRAEIRPFADIYLPRIAQLTNKSNQFNLTTKRLTQQQLEAMAADPDTVTLYGRLEDKFGDNGLVSVVAASKHGHILFIDLWLMSCRVLKRGMEHAMMDALVAQARALGVTELIGCYYKTEKNGMVSGFYEDFGFEHVDGRPGGNTVWRLLLDGYETQNKWIEVNT